MSNNFILTLDTTGPGSPLLKINSGALYTSSQSVTLSIGTSDVDTTGYTFKVWGDVDTTQNPKIQTTLENSGFIDFVTSQTVKLSTIDGIKTLNLAIYDDVMNQSEISTSTIILDTASPVVTINGPDVSKISKIEGKNTSIFTFQCDTDFAEYEIRVVSSVDADHTMGSIIPITGGSVNMSGNTGNYGANNPVNCQIKGADLQAASSGDGEKIIKVFVKDVAENWSI